MQNKVNDAYAADFLFSRGIDFMTRQIESDKQFALMISIPDPHGTNNDRPPYDIMYDYMNLKQRSLFQI